MTKKFKILIVAGIILVIILSGFLIWRKFYYLDPNAFATYYKIFDKKEILDGSETEAKVVDEKLDKRLKKYHDIFAKIAGTNDEAKLKALFYMNFVHYYGIYGKPGLNEFTLKEILTGSDYFQCGTNATLLAMLLEKAGYETRTVSINNGAHGLVEVKFDGNWNLLDPTTNIWFDKSTEELAAGAAHNTKEFKMAAEDESNARAREHMTAEGIKCNLFCLKKQMLSIGDKFKVKVDKYNYVDLSQYQY